MSPLIIHIPLSSGDCKAQAKEIWQPPQRLVPQLFSGIYPGPLSWSGALLRQKFGRAIGSIQTDPIEGRSAADRQTVLSF